MSAVSRLRSYVRPLRVVAVALMIGLLSTSCGVVDSITGDSANSSGEFVVQAYVEEQDVGNEIELERTADDTSDTTSSRGIRVLATDDHAAEPAATLTSSTVTEAASRSDSSDTKRFEISMQIEGPTAVGDRDVPYAIGASAGEWTNFTVDMGSSLVELDDTSPLNRDAMQLNYISDSSTLYINAPLFAEFERMTPGFFDAIPFARAVATGWGRVDMAALGGNQSNSASNPVASPAPDVDEILAMVGRSTNMRDGGTSSVRGVATTVIIAEVTFDDIAIAMDGENDLGLTEADLRNVAPTDVEIHIDDDGLVRRIEWDFNLADVLPASQQSSQTAQSFWFRFDLFDFGEPIVISAPESSTDITAELLDIIELNEQLNGG